MPARRPRRTTQVGFGGTKIETKFVDEAGSTAQVVTEFRNLVQRDQVDAVVGYISSGSCLAVTPVADELQGADRAISTAARRASSRRSRANTCSVRRRTPPWITPRAARYLLAKKKDITLFSGINQNYAWGQDSWKDFVGAMGVLAPEGEGRQGAVPQAVPGRVRRGDFHAADLEVAGAALQLLGRRPGELHHPERRARPAKRMPYRRHHRRDPRSGVCATRCRTAPSSARAARTARSRPTAR